MSSINEHLRRIQLQEQLFTLGSFGASGPVLSPNTALQEEKNPNEKLLLLL